jgi:hypothetical protein
MIQLAFGNIVTPPFVTYVRYIRTVATRWHTLNLLFSPEGLSWLLQFHLLKRLPSSNFSILRHIHLDLNILKLCSCLVYAWLINLKLFPIFNLKLFPHCYWHCWSEIIKVQVLWYIFYASFTWAVMFQRLAVFPNRFSVNASLDPQKTKIELKIVI